MSDLGVMMEVSGLRLRGEQMALGQDKSSGSGVIINASLTSQLTITWSPVRRFLDARFACRLATVQRWYRESAPDLVVPGPDPREVNIGTLCTAADWLMRFLLHPAPPLRLPAAGARLFASHTGMSAALSEIAGSLGLADIPMHGSDDRFTGPVHGSSAEPEHLARACWVLALFTEVFQTGPLATAQGPLKRFRDQPVLAEQLLDLAPPAALDQLASFRSVFLKMLIPRLSIRPGRWYLDPEFVGSQLLNADAELIAAGLLINLKTTTRRPSLSRTDLFRVIGYALLDFDDAHQITDLGIFSARYAYLATWDIQTLMDELAGHVVSLSDTREEFRRLLIAHGI
jgi:hypothetical protein